LERAAAYGNYDGGLRELMHLLKYNGVRPAARVLGRMLAEVLTALEPAFEPAMFERSMFEPAPVLVIPVPLYKTKRRQRGFNQAELIARNALRFYPARALLQLAPDILRRTRDMPSQVDMTSHQRRANLRGLLRPCVRRKSLAATSFLWMMSIRPGQRRRSVLACCIAPGPPRYGWRQWRVH
jgi:predicted amidophosphoribosyltransferase